MSLLVLRQQLQTHLTTCPALSSTTILLERAGTDIDGLAAAALSADGQVVILLSPEGATLDQTPKAGRVILGVGLTVLLVESPNVIAANARPPFENTMPSIIAALLARQVGHGELSLAKEPYARATDDNGDLFHYLHLVAPLSISAA